MSEGVRAMDQDYRAPAEKPGPANPPDLAYELQSKLFEQLAAMGIAGAGLSSRSKAAFSAERPV